VHRSKKVLLWIGTRGRKKRCQIGSERRGRATQGPTGSSRLQRLKAGEAAVVEEEAST
jgi:hypothetical protein